MMTEQQQPVTGTCRMVECCHCRASMKAHLADYTLRDKPRWEWVPICFHCKYPWLPESKARYKK